MFLFAVTFAHAGLRADLDREARDAPEIAIACTSAKETLARVRDGAALVRDDDVPDATPVPPELAGFLDGLGGVLADDARVSVGWWESPSVMRIGFDTSLDAGALATALAAIDAGAPATAVQGPEGWRLRDPDGSEMSVTVTAGWAQIARGAPPSAPPRILPAPLLAALPEEPGCAVAAHVTDKEMGEVDMVFHLPFTAGRPGSFAFALPQLADSSAVLLSGAVPPEVRTPAAPVALVALGIGLDSIDFSAFLKGKELAEARRLQGFFPITGGTVVAVLQGNGGAPGGPPPVAAVIPFAGKVPARVLTRRLLKISKELELPATKVDATHVSLRVQDVDILFAAAQSRLYVASDAGVLAALEGGVGTPWITPKLAAVTSEWPLVVTTSEFPSALGGPEDGVLPRPFLLTLDVEGGVIKGLVDVPLTLPQLAKIGETFQAARAARKMRDARNAASAPGTEL